jgi:hypothetical protein
VSDGGGFIGGAAIGEIVFAVLVSLAILLLLGVGEGARRCGLARQIGCGGTLGL